MVAATASSLVEIYAGYGLLIGLGTGFAYVPAMAAVQRWFDAHRGLASGIAVERHRRRHGAGAAGRRCASSAALTGAPPSSPSASSRP